VTSIGSSNSGNDEIVGGKYCGDYHDALVVTSISNRLRIEFVSDNSVEKTGFAAYFLTGNPIFCSILPTTNYNVKILMNAKRTKAAVNTNASI
jgi:hypothetical protein